MRGPRRDKTAEAVTAGNAFTQKVRRGKYELGIPAPARVRVAVGGTALLIADGVRV